MNLLQRIVLVAGSITVLALAFFPPFFPGYVRHARFEIRLAAVTLATVGLVLALRGLPKYSLAPGGWRRLWMVLSLIYLLAVIGLAWKLFPTHPSEEARERASFQLPPIFGERPEEQSLPPRRGLADFLPDDEEERRRAARLPVRDPAAPSGWRERFGVTPEEEQRLRALRLAEIRADLLREQQGFVLKAILLWAGPVGAAYFLGVAGRWVYCGFRPAPQQGAVGEEPTFNRDRDS